MTKSYSRDHLKLSVAKTLQTLGWHSINSTPLEVMTDILSTFMENIGRTTNQYASDFGHTEPNLDHLGLTFRDMGIEVQELEEYTTFVNFAPPAAPVPQYPLAKEDHLNFLKPGSKEVVTRPVYIHEHLPPMHPLLEEPEVEKEMEVKEEVPEEPAPENQQVFKKPIDISPSEFKRANCRKEEESSRPTRELSSVIMTTSGYLSPAREGRLPESRTPVPPPVEPVFPPQPPPPENVEHVRKPPKPFKPFRKMEKKRDRIGKELFKPDENKRKVPGIKELSKIKQKNSFLNSLPTGTEVKVSQMPMVNKPPNINKMNRNLPPAALEIEKFNTTITPIPMKKEPQDSNHNEIHTQIDKLLTEPDKKKLNNLKKIFNVKEPKGNKKEDRLKSRENSPSLVNEMAADEIATKLSSLPCDVTIEPITVPHKVARHEKAEKGFFDGHPLTPSLPKTPDIMPARMPPQKEKRKRKPRAPRAPKHANIPFNPECMSMRMERPTTPDVGSPMKQEPTFPNLPLPLGYPFTPFGGPGLIPSPLLSNPLAPNPMFPFGLGQMPYLPTLRGVSPHVRNPVPMPRFNPPIKSEEPPPAKIPKIEKKHSPVPAHHHHRDHHHKAPSPQPQALPPQAPPPPPHPQHQPPQHIQPPPPTVPPPAPSTPSQPQPEEEIIKPEKKIKDKDHKKDKKDKLKKKSKKDKIKNKSEKKKKLKIEKKDKDKLKKEKKEKRKEKEALQFKESEIPSIVPKLTLKLDSSSRPGTPEMKKLIIKPIIKREENVSFAPSTTDEIIKREVKCEPSAGLAKISALVTGPPKQKLVASPVQVAEEMPREVPSAPPVPRNIQGPGRPRVHPVLPPKPEAVKKDQDGNDVWICPACGRQDDGSPMIGCDDCDAWYHWICVGIRTEPDENENWYCQYCIIKKNEDFQIEKKKKRKKREKKDH